MGIFVIIVNFPAMELNVQDPWFTALADGTKNVEGRLDKPKYADLDKGDTITFKLDGGDATVERTVKTVHTYDSFEKMLKREKIENVLPGIESIEDGVEIYRKFYKKDLEEGLISNVTSICGVPFGAGGIPH